MDIEKLNEAYGKAVAVATGLEGNELGLIAHDVVIFLGGLIEAHDDTVDSRLAASYPQQDGTDGRQATDDAASITG